MNHKRVIIVHTHIFKNAGTSLDWILQKNFGKNFLEHRKAKEMRQGGPEYLKNIYMENPELIAVSSHHIPFNPKDMENEDMKVLPIYIIREPIDRTLSVYKFEKKQKNVQTEGSIMAKKLGFLEFVKWSLNERKSRTLRNMNTMYASGVRGASSNDELEHAYKNLKNTPFVGIVDRFDESMVVFEDALKPYFPNIDLSYIAQNVNQKENKTLSQKHGEIKELLGEDLYEEVKEVNANDLKLYIYINNLLDERIVNIDNFKMKLVDFQERSKNLGI